MCPYEKCLETYLMIPISIKMRIRKKSENLFNDPGTNVPIKKVWKHLMILVSMCPN